MSCTLIPPTPLKLAGQQVVGLPAGPQTAAKPWKVPAQPGMVVMAQCVPVQQAPVSARQEFGLQAEPTLKVLEQLGASVTEQVARLQQAPMGLMRLICRTYVPDWPLNPATRMV